MTSEAAPLLSIVTISFNQRSFIHRALASVCPNPRIEHIVVDPGSSDGTVDYLRQRWSSSKKIILKPDRGPADGLNNGFMEARGRFGYFLNSDDFVLPGAIENFLRVLECADDDVVFGGGYVLDLTQKWAREIIMPRQFSRTAFSYNAFPFLQQGMFFRLDLFRSVGGFNPASWVFWDSELFVDLLKAGGRACCVRDLVGVFVLHEKSITGTGTHGTEEARVERQRITEKLLNRHATPMDRLIGGRIAHLTRRVFGWRWGIADLRDRLFPSYSYKKVMAVYDALAEPD